MPTLKFVVIPTKNTYEEYSEEIVSKIKDVNNCNAELDKNYNETLNTRVNKYKKNNKNVITIGLSEVEHDTIMIHFNGARPKTMECEEFIALLESYEEEPEEPEELEEPEESEEDNESESSSSDSSDDDVGSMFKKQKSVKCESTKKEENKEGEEEEENCIIN
jgi:hypothetical protein